MSRNVGIAALLALGLLLPASVQAQTFVDPRQAPVDQYGTPTPTPAAPTPTPTPVPRTATPTPTPGDGGEASGPRDDAGRDAAGGRGEAGGGGGGGQDAGGVRRESGGLADELPFTGLNLLTLILIGLMLTATGLALRAEQKRRAKRA